jgi:two-component system response regulator HydG
MKEKILLVDDNVDFIDSVKDVLEDEGYHVVAALSGEEAVSLTLKEAFDLVLMDIKMPGMNGVESLVKMKEKSPDIKVILFTAYAIEELIQQARNEGAWAVLKKPLNLGYLLSIIKEIGHQAKGDCILIADDDASLCDNLLETLTESGYPVAVVGNGPDALRKMEHQNFDILLLDMKLPGLNGLEVYRQIKAKQPRLVTIIMTGYAEEMSDLVHQAVSENAYSYLTKPIDMNQLLSLLNKVYTDKKAGIIEKPSLER